MKEQQKIARIQNKEQVMKKWENNSMKWNAQIHLGKIRTPRDELILKDGPLSIIYKFLHTEITQYEEVYMHNDDCSEILYDAKYFIRVI